MEELNPAFLIDAIRTKCKRHYQTREDGNVMHSIITNTGIRPGQVAYRHKGDYQGIRVEALSHLFPLLTSSVVIQSLEAVQRQQYDLAMTLVRADTTLQYLWILKTWLRVAVNTLVSDEVIFSHSPDLEQWAVDNGMIEWLTSDRHTPLPCRLRVVATGTGSSHMPEEWAGREFSSGDALQKEWSEVRRGPPVTYAITYNLMLETRKDTLTVDEARLVPTSVIYLLNGVVKSTSDQVVDGYDYVLYDDVLIGHSNLVEEQEEIRSESVSVLVSRLQKCIRYGPESTTTLLTTLVSLAQSPDYYLPDRGYERVSAARQLLWRTYISLIEEVGNVEGLETVILMTLVCNRVRGHLVDDVLLWVSDLLTRSLFISTAYNWKAYVKTKGGETSSGSHYSLALRFMPMMEGDDIMLRAYLQGDPAVIPLPEIDLPDVVECESVRVRSIDHHCKPAISILYQATLPLSYSIAIADVSRMVWTESSRYNYRDSSHDEPSSTTELYQLQKWLLAGVIPTRDSQSTSKSKLVSLALTPIQRRRAFISLFSSYPAGKRAVYAGDEDLPLKRMSGGVWESVAAVDGPVKTIKTTHLPPPLGYQWSSPSFCVQIKSGKPIVNGQVIEWYDGSSLLTPHLREYAGEDDTALDAISLILSGEEVAWGIYETLMEVAASRLEWYHRVEANVDLIRLLLVKLDLGVSEGRVEAGPVDRSGRATHSPVHPLLEGRSWGALVLLSYLYPGALAMLPSLIAFRVTPGADLDHMIRSLRLLHDRLSPRIESAVKPEITTRLWDHQSNSVRRVSSVFESGGYGVGDASYVGAGKSLVALTVAAALGTTLILVPSPALISSWQVEIDKHTKGFRAAYQAANGSLKWLDDRVIDSDPNLVVSTMARMRDHPLSRRWSLVVIDECLSVQNGTALWTAEAWRQTCMADHVLMLSATFFRSRYDKLYYMLKMLRSGLPEDKEHLDVLLLETIVSQQPVNGRIWSTTVRTLDPSSQLLAQHQAIASGEGSDEHKYIKLQSLLHSFSIIDQLTTLVSSLSGRLLIYARSKREAEDWSHALSIPLYPDISQDRVIVTTAVGTYGLNDLVKYDTIVCRPPEPDKLPQMKGRLDRPGQKSNELSLVYFYVRDTIEEGLLRRLDIANSFSSNYVMPLSRFYRISLYD